LIILALGAMAVFAGVVLVLALLTGGAEIDVSAQLSGAASGDIGQGPAVRGEQLLLIASQVLWAVTAHDVGQFQHGLSDGSLETRGQVIERMAGVLLDFVGQMGVEDGGIGGAVAQVFLNGAQIDAGFQQMGGIGMAQLMF
jgi:hypothetical protein